MDFYHLNKRTDLNSRNNTLDTAVHATNMERIPIDREQTEENVIQNDKQESDLLRKLEKYTDSSGFIEYPGWEPAYLRKGSSVYELIQWHLYSKNTKPIDYDIFTSLLREMTQK